MTGDPRDLNVSTPSFPTRRSSDQALETAAIGDFLDQYPVVGQQGFRAFDPNLGDIIADGLTGRHAEEPGEVTHAQAFPLRQFSNGDGIVCVLLLQPLADASDLT